MGTLMCPDLEIRKVMLSGARNGCPSRKRFL